MGRHRDDRTLLQRLLDSIKIDVNGCWIWQASKNNIGYGFIRDAKRMRTVHRVSYEEHNNVFVPRNMCVLHKCNNYDCVNPAHLFVGTRKDLSAEMLRKGNQKYFGGITHLGRKRQKQQCPHCNKMISSNLFSRWHGDNCKMNAVA